MTTFREAVAARQERIRRERRYYTPDILGPKCKRCPLRIPRRLALAGILEHPTCSPEFPELLDLDRQR